MCSRASRDTKQRVRTRALPFYRISSPIPIFVKPAKRAFSCRRRSCRVRVRRSDETRRVGDGASATPGKAEARRGCGSGKSPSGDSSLRRFSCSRVSAHLIPFFVPCRVRRRRLSCLTARHARRAGRSRRRASSSLELARRHELHGRRTPTDASVSFRARASALHQKDSIFGKTRLRCQTLTGFMYSQRRRNVYVAFLKNSTVGNLTPIACECSFSQLHLAFREYGVFGRQILTHSCQSRAASDKSAKLQNNFFASPSLLQYLAHVSAQSLVPIRKER